MAQARWTRPVVALTAIAVCVLALPGVAEAGWFAYTANRGANTISQYSIASDGSLSSLGATTAVANSAPWDVVVSPDARSLYASYAGSLNAVAEFDIGPDGTLTPKPGHETIAAGGGANNLAISPDGKQLYVANFSGNSSGSTTSAMAACCRRSSSTHCPTGWSRRPSWWLPTVRRRTRRTTRTGRSGSSRRCPTGASAM